MNSIKFLLIFLILGILAVSFVACGEKSENEPQKQNQEQSQEEVTIPVQEEQNERIPNPVVSYESVEDAVIAVGHLSPLPNIYERYSKDVSVIADSIIQIIYSDDEGEKLVLREQAGTETDISGVYYSYAYNSTIQSNGIDVSIKGTSEDSIEVVTWNDGAYAHSLYYEGGVSLEEVTAAVNDINS